MRAGGLAGCGKSTGTVQHIKLQYPSIAVAVRSIVWESKLSHYGSLVANRKGGRFVIDAVAALLME